MTTNPFGHVAEAITNLGAGSEETAAGMARITEMSPEAAKRIVAHHFDGFGQQSSIQDLDPQMKAALDEFRTQGASGANVGNIGLPDARVRGDGQDTGRY